MTEAKSQGIETVNTRFSAYIDLAFEKAITSQ